MTGWVVAATIPNDYHRLWLLCPSCGKGSVKNDGVLWPFPQSFPAIKGMPDDINRLYDEARVSFDAQAYTGCEMLCRKILMNTAVDKGAKKNLSFEHYVDYLNAEGHFTPLMKKMAEKIRLHGNKSTHETEPSTQGNAKHALYFTNLILDAIYGAEHALKQHDNS